MSDREQHSMPTGDEAVGFRADHRLASALALSELRRADVLPDIADDVFDKCLVPYIAQFIANWEARGLRAQWPSEEQITATARAMVLRVDAEFERNERLRLCKWLHPEERAERIAEINAQCIRDMLGLVAAEGASTSGHAPEKHSSDRRQDAPTRQATEREAPHE